MDIWRKLELLCTQCLTILISFCDNISDNKSWGMGLLMNVPKQNYLTLSNITGNINDS